MLLLGIAFLVEIESEKKLGRIKNRLIFTFPFLHASNAVKLHLSSPITTKADLQNKVFIN